MHNSIAVQRYSGMSQAVIGIIVGKETFYRTEKEGGGDIAVRQRKGVCVGGGGRGVPAAMDAVPCSISLARTLVRLVSVRASLAQEEASRLRRCCDRFRSGSLAAECT